MEKQARQEADIDLKKLATILLVKKKMVFSLLVVCTAIGLIIPYTQPKVYSSYAVLQIVKESKPFDVTNITNNVVFENGQRVLNPTEIIEEVKSPLVLSKALDAMTFGDEQDKISATAAISKTLKIETIRQTNMIKVSAGGRTPEEAQAATQAIVESFLSIHAGRDKAKFGKEAEFLSKQTEEAREAAEQADQKLIAFSGRKDEFNPEYRQLKREAKAREDIYVSLLKAQEQSRIAESMGSTDVQLAVPAAVTSEETGLRAKKKLLAVGGFLAGCLLALGYGLFCYRQEFE